MTQKTTIVSAFISNINKSPDRNVDKYIEDGNLLMEANISKVIFVDEDLYYEFKRRENENTKIIRFTKNQNYLYEYEKYLTNFHLHTENPCKDTIDFMFLMSHKTEFVNQAIQMNFFDTTNYMWVDFGIKHMFQNITNREFITIIENLDDRLYDNVRISSIWDVNLIYNIEIYKRVVWYFAGSVFGGNKDKLVQFARLNRDMCIKIMKEQNTIMWEVNIWYLVYKENPDLFNPYMCDHNNSILTTY